MDDVDVAVEWLARALCAMNNIAPIDPMDGSSNWWVFVNDVEPLVKSLKERGFKFEALESLRKQREEAKTGSIPEGS